MFTKAGKMYFPGINLWYLFFIFPLFISCEKKNDRPQWDVEVIGPVLQASLGVEDIIADSLLTQNGNGELSLVFEQDFYNLQPDSIYTIPDTSLSNIVLWPIFTTTIQPNTPFYSNDNKIALGLGSVKLKKAYMKRGVIRIELKNSLPTKVIYTYTIPKAKKAGSVFTVVRTVDASSSAGPGVFTGSFDLDDYELDLTGSDGSLFNTISYNIQAVSDPDGSAFTINTNDTVINIETELLDLEPVYARGYLGQESISESGSDNTGFNRYITGGIIELDSVRMDLELRNYIGADAQARILSLSSVNDRTGNSIILSAPSLLNRNLNINRAQESGPVISPVIPSIHSYRLDNSNSNIKNFVENLPDRISYDVGFQLNPLGNISLYNDFLYSDQLVEGKVILEFPLRLAAQNLVLADTQDLSLSGLTDLDPVGPATFTLVAKNGFPLDLDVELLILDEQYLALDSLLVPGFIRKANLDSQYRVLSSSETVIDIPVDAQRKQRILSGTFMGIRIRFNSPDFAQKVQLYESHRLDLKLIADGTYYIR